MACNCPGFRCAESFAFWSGERSRDKIEDLELEAAPALTNAAPAFPLYQSIIINSAMIIIINIVFMTSHKLKQRKMDIWSKFTMKLL